MKIFDSRSHIKWSGSNYSVQKKSDIVLRKGAFIRQNIDFEPGSYSLRVIGKKRTGNGRFEVSIASESGEIIASEKIQLTKSSLSESRISFDVEKACLGGRILVQRGGVSFGTIEISRIIVECDSEELASQKDNSITASNHTHLVSGENFKKRDIAFVVPYGICGGGEVYIRNIIDNMNNEIFNITVICCKKNKIKDIISNKNVNIINAINDDHFKSTLISNNYHYIVYYNSHRIYQILQSLYKSNLISSQMYEVYHSDFIWQDSLSRYNERENISGILFVSEMVGRSISYVPEKTVLPVGIEIERFEKGVGSGLIDNYDGNFIFGMVTRLSLEKNIKYAIDLVSKTNGATLVIVGDGPSEQSIRKYIKTNNIDNVTLVGFKTNTQDYYKLFDSFLMTSSCSEGTPISILESMASETLVVSTMTGGIPSIVRDGKTGVSISGIIDDDLSVLNKIIANKDDYNDIVLNAKRYVDLNHNIENIARSFENIILNNSGFFVSSDEKSIILDGYYA